jgi:hypothetical protein
MSTNGTIAERINVLGAPDTACTTDRERGYCEAIDACLEIAEEADEIIKELAETIDDMLTGPQRLKQWVEGAETLLARLKQREIIR